MTSRWCQYLQVIPKIKNSLSGQRSLNSLPGFSEEFSIAGHFISCFYFFYTIIVLYIQLTPDNTNPRQHNLVLTSNQNQFPLDLLHLFTVILPLVTLTLNNSNLLLTRRNFCLPSDHFQIILHSKTWTMFWALKKLGKKSVLSSETLILNFPLTCCRHILLVY